MDHGNIRLCSANIGVIHDTLSILMAQIPCDFQFRFKYQKARTLNPAILINILCTVPLSCPALGIG